MAYEWCRLYNKIINNQTMRGMPGDWFRAWVFLMVLANKGSERGIVPVDDRDGLANLLCLKPGELEPFMDKLASVGMAQQREDGSIELSNFRELQYDFPSQLPERVEERKSKAKTRKRSSSENKRGTSVERVGNECGTSAEQAGHKPGTPYRLQTTDISTPPTPPGGEGVLADNCPEQFVVFWNAYPHKREKNSAFKAWEKALSEGTSPDDLIAAAKGYAAANPGKAQKYFKFPANFIEGGDWAEYIGATAMPANDSPKEVAGRYIPSAEETRAYLRSLQVSNDG